MKFLRKITRSSIQAPLLRGILSRGFFKANAVFAALADERMMQIYARYREYTRLNAEAFVANLKLVERFSNLDGCVVECGVWRGGMSAGMADIHVTFIELG